MLLVYSERWRIFMDLRTAVIRDLRTWQRWDQSLDYVRFRLLQTRIAENTYATSPVLIVLFKSFSSSEEGNEKDAISLPKAVVYTRI